LLIQVGLRDGIGTCSTSIEKKEVATTAPTFVTVQVTVEWPGLGRPFEELELDEAQYTPVDPLRSSGPHLRF
jgi:hypothetical protein